jgi:hypothetical protein
VRLDRLGTEAGGFNHEARRWLLRMRVFCRTVRCETSAAAEQLAGKKGYVYGFESVRRKRQFFLWNRAILV